MISLVREEKLEKFYKYLESVSISDKEKNDIRFLVQFLRGRTNPELSNRTFLFYGSPGTGKSFLAEKILGLLDGVRILYAGCANLNKKGIMRCYGLDGIYRSLEKGKEYVIFIDDLRYVADYDDCGDIEDSDLKSLMKILECVKKSKNRTVFICTVNDFEFQEAVHDRIEVKIEMSLPSEENRAAFIRNNYSEYIPKDMFSYVNNNLIGYNYRDIPELIKIAYRQGNGEITKKSLREAFRTHTPSSMMDYPLVKSLELRFNDVIGRSVEKKVLKNVIRLVKNPELVKKFGLKKCNLVIFHGPNGTGKSFMARALAGELEYSLMDYGAKHFYARGPTEGINSLMKMATRFKNCVIFIDEAEKIFDRKSLDLDEGPLIGEFNRLIEGAGEKRIEAVLVLAANNLQKLPKSLLDRAITIGFKQPDYTERLGFIKKMLTQADTKEFDIIPEELATMTDGLSFRDLQRLWRDAVQEALDKDTHVSMKDFKNTLNKRKEDENIRGYVG